MTNLASIHNIAFVGHPSSGKTTLVDALSHLIGASARKGSVADKTSICDYEPEEQEKQHTLQTAVVSGQWEGKSWTLFDTPGYPEFVSEVQGAMFGADLVVGVVSCSSGATYNLRTKMQSAEILARGRAIVITHLDGENADFEQTVMDLRESIGEVCVPVLLPDASGADFSSVRRTVNDPESDWCQRLKDRVMDACEDEELLMEYLENQELSEDQLHDLMPAAIAKGSVIPILVCHPESGLAVENVLKFLNRFAPSPGNLPMQNADGENIDPDPSATLSGTVFNAKSDAHVGRVCIARIHQGTLKTADLVGVTSGEKGEKLGGLFRMVGKNRENVDSAGPGEVIAFSKVDHIPIWGDFSSGGDPVNVRKPMLHTPMVALAVVPKSRADEQKIGEALNKLVSEDPTFSLEHAKDTHELVIHGMSDLHLQVMLDRLKRRYGVEVETSIPKITYHETVTRPSEGHHRHRKQSGGRGQFGECFIRLKPRERGAGMIFTDAIPGGSIPRNLIPAVEKGIHEAAAGGILTNGKVVDVEVELYDGKFHAVDSDEGSFKMAGGRAFRDGFEKAGPVLLEPVMELDIHIPTDMAGTVFSDLTSQRRGHVHDQTTEPDGAHTLIKAEAPLAMVQTYHRDLKSQTAGEGSFAMRFSHFAAVPSSEQAKVLAAIGKKHEED